MSRSKTTSEVSIMKDAGKMLGEVVKELMLSIKPGVSELEIDNLAEKLIKEKGGSPGFKRVPGYKHSICVSVNDVVVHGIPTNYKFREGDVVGIDCGVYYKGLNTDCAETVKVQRNNFSGIKSGKIDDFLKIGKKALFDAIDQAKGGNRVGNISKTIQDEIEGNGYSVVRSLVGHGVGKSLHEEPEVPGFLMDRIDKTPLLKPGMTIAVEVIYNMGKKEVVYSNDDGWTIKTKDDSLSGLFERTILITKDQPVILTPV